METNYSKLDRTAFSIIDLSESGKDFEYWQKRGFEDRLEALELIRQAIYGYDETTARLQRVFGVDEFPRS